MTSSNSNLSTLSTDYDQPLVQYIRDNETNQHIGLLLAAIDRDTNQIRIGWSLTRHGSNDIFSKDRAYTIAIGRVELAHIHKITIPFALAETGVLENFVLRCMKYYKSNNVQVFGRIRKDLDDVSELSYQEFSIN
jgi:hypothetical protein